MLISNSYHFKMISLTAYDARRSAVARHDDGPLANQNQHKRIQASIEQAIADGLLLVCDSAGRPEGLAEGYFAQPTIFADVDSRLARQEVFGPVLAIIPFEDGADAIRIANDSAYGLAAYVHSQDLERAERIATSLRAGHVLINGASVDFSAPL